MITFVLTMRRKAGLTKEQFRQHYETSHVALAKKYVGHLFADYSRNYVISGNAVAEEGYDIGATAVGGYDVATTIAFKDQAALDEFFAIMNRPEVGSLFKEDEKRFVDRPSMYMSICEQVKTWTAADLTA
jgi:hypothetical protein